MRKLFVTLGLVVATILGTMGTALAWHGVPGGTSSCNKDGTVTYTFTIQNWNDTNPGTVTTRLGVKVATETAPAIFTETLKATSDSLDWVITWPQSEERGSGTINLVFDGTCVPTVHHTRGNFSAGLDGPCGDPFYRAVLRNGTSSPRVFRFFYTAFGGGKTIVTRTVRAGTTYKTQYKHVLGGTRLLIKSGGKVLISKTAAPAGSYGRCAA